MRAWLAAQSVRAMRSGGGIVVQRFVVDLWKPACACYGHERCQSAGSKPALASGVRH